MPRAHVQFDLDLAEPELLLHERQRAPDHLIHGDQLTADRRHAPEGAKVRDDFGGLADLSHGVLQLARDMLLVRHAEPYEVERVAHEQSDVVQRIVELVGDAGGELAECGKLARLDELLLLVA